jgi:hypothetical protein
MQRSGDSRRNITSGISPQQRSPYPRPQSALSSPPSISSYNTSRFVDQEREHYCSEARVHPEGRLRDSLLYGSAAFDTRSLPVSQSIPGPSNRPQSFNMDVRRNDRPTSNQTLNWQVDPGSETLFSSSSYASSSSSILLATESCVSP